MIEIIRQLERDAAFMKMLPYAGALYLAPSYALYIDDKEANRISNNLAQAAREIERLERELEALGRVMK